MPLYKTGRERCPSYVPSISRVVALKDRSSTRLPRNSERDFVWETVWRGICCQLATSTFSPHVILERDAASLPGMTMKPLQCFLTAGKSMALVLTTLMIAPAPCAYGQQERDGDAKEQTEDQLIAQALWAMVQTYPESLESDDAKQAFDAAQDAFPNSARVAYWRGKCGFLQANMTRTLQRLVEVTDSLSDPGLEASTDDPATKRKLGTARPYVEQIRRRIQTRLDNSDDADDQADSDLAFLRAVQLDLTLTAAWVGLLESSDASVAVSAAEGWAKIEPDNALPLYAKAVVLTRDHLRLRTPVDEKAIEAIETGNQRPDCIAPDLPWPTGFHLTFSQAWDEEVPGIAGRQVPEPLLRIAVERLFSQLEAIGNWSTISSSALQDLGVAILSTSHQLPLEHDIRQLRAFVGCGIHSADSNRLVYGITMGVVERHLNRLETIAVDQQDFESARAFQSIQKHLLETRRAVAGDYQANNEKSEPEQESEIDTLLNIELPRDDVNATRVMQSREDPPEVPEIVTTSTDPSDSVIIGTDASSKDLDMLCLDLVFSEDPIGDSSVPIRG